MPLEAVLALVVAAILAACLLQFFGRYFLSYVVTEESVKIVLFRFLTVLRIEYRDIAGVELLSFKDSLWPSLAWRFGNRLFFKEVVVIEKRKGIFSRVIITPDNAREFVAQMSRNLRDGRNWAARPGGSTQQIP